ncbi:MAG: DNA polymerase III subunit delta' [bacterium]
MNLPLVRGHDATWAQLTARLDNQRLAHALLFLGPPGIGKALVAQRLTARLACTTGGSAAPCGECDGCRQVLAGSHPDLMLIGAPGKTKKGAQKKEIGIEQARALKHFIQLQPVTAARKMAIVDDADRLSLAAQNALLKTLEEPPGQALLLLVTASPGALLSTVRSRCQRVAFRPLPTALVGELLVESGLSVDEAAHLAGLADGSPGRALSLRATWRDSDRDEVLGALAALQGGRYASVLAMSNALGKTEPETAARLTGLLTACHDTAVAAAATGEADGLAHALQQGEAVAEALSTLRRRNPNRTLLSEALALRLARTR